MTGLFSNPTMRMEMIDFQLNSKFGSKLEAEVEKIFEYIEKKNYEDWEVQKLEQIKNIETIILKEIGLNVFLTTTAELAAIIPFHLSESAILSKNQFIRANWYTNEQKEFREVTAGEKGFVDEENVKLGGIFSKYKNTLFMDFNKLKTNYKLSVRETVAVLLHELGHGFYACAYSARIDRGNQIISNALKAATGSKGKKMEVFFKELKENGVVIKKEVVDGLSSTNPTVFSQSVLTFSSECIMNQLENEKYSETSFEQLADNFSARFGYGDALVSGLEKFTPGGVKYEGYIIALTIAMKLYDRISMVFNSLWVLLNIDFSNVIKLIPYIGTIFRVFRNIFFCTIWLYAFLKTSGEAGRSYTYDDTVHRYNRIRQQVIEAIKTGSLTKAQAKECIATVEFIGNLIKDCKPYRGPIDFLFNTFNPKDRRAKKSIERQQAIEDLMANPLFVASLKAKLAAG